MRHSTREPRQRMRSDAGSVCTRWTYLRDTLVIMVMMMKIVEMVEVVEVAGVTNSTQN